MGRIASFSSRLKEALSARNMTQAELSKRTGINKSSISHYINGHWEGKQDAIYAIATAMNISEAWLMGYDVPMESSEYENMLNASKIFKKSGLSMDSFPLIRKNAKPSLRVDDIVVPEEELFDDKLLTMLLDLSPDEEREVLQFVEFLKAKRKA